MGTSFEQSVFKQVMRIWQWSMKASALMQPHRLLVPVQDLSTMSVGLMATLIRMIASLAVLEKRQVCLRVVFGEFINYPCCNLCLVACVGSDIIDTHISCCELN